MSRHLVVVTYGCFFVISNIVIVDETISMSVSSLPLQEQLMRPLISASEKERIMKLSDNGVQCLKSH